MAKKPTNSHQPWTDKEVKQLQKLAEGNTPTRVIGLKLGRSPSAIYNKASQESVNLRPTNQKPYGTKKK